MNQTNINSIETYNNLKQNYLEYLERKQKYLVENIKLLQKQIVDCCKSFDYFNAKEIMLYLNKLKDHLKICNDSIKLLNNDISQTYQTINKTISSCMKLDVILL